MSRNIPGYAPKLNSENELVGKVLFDLTHVQFVLCYSGLVSPLT